jgi:hypothetical protein
MSQKAAKPPCATSKRGGFRENAGRRRKATNIDPATSNEVLNRLGELGIPGVKTKADYVLHLMKTDKHYAGLLFLDMLNRSEGKPAQARMAQGTLTINVKEMTAGNHSAAEAGPSTQVM